jgi:hypothetical protein
MRSLRLHLGIGIGRRGVTIIPDPSKNYDGSAHIRRGFSGRPDFGVTYRLAGAVRGLDARKSGGRFRSRR